MEKVKKKLGLDNLKTHHFPRILAVVLVFFLTGGILVYRLVTERAEKAMVERVKVQELTLARSGALTINQLFKERKVDLLLLAELEPVKAGKEKEGRQAIKNLVDHLRGEVLASVVRVDKEGKSQWWDNPQHERVEEGVDLADRDYFLWAKEQETPGEVFLSQPAIARAGLREGEWIVVMATPVFYQDKFNGLVFISFPLEDLTEKYIIPLISTPRTQSMIVTEDGTIITSSLTERVGENVQDYLQEQAKLISAKAPIRIDKQVWSLWVSVPYEEALRLASPVNVIQIKGLVFGLIGLLILVLTFILGVRVAQRDAFLDGFRNGRKKR